MEIDLHNKKSKYFNFFFLEVSYITRLPDITDQSNHENFDKPGSVRTKQTRFSQNHIYCSIRPFYCKGPIFGGDFRQILPVVPKGRREDIVSSCLLRSPL